MPFSKITKATWNNFFGFALIERMGINNMKDINKRFFALALAVFMVVSFAACGKAEPEVTTGDSEPLTTTAATVSETTAETTAASKSETVSETEGPSHFVTGTVATSATDTTEPVPAVTVNYLTGLPLAEGENELFRPFICTINNLKIAAKNHRGISKADIIYEVEVEGGITRLLAVFSDTEGVGDIGPIRSARPVMNCIVLGHDGYFGHAGGSDQAKSELAAYGMADIDGSGRYGRFFFYDDAVVKATSLEHGYYTNGDNIVSAINAYHSNGGRSEVSDGHNNLFTFFSEVSDLAGGQPCAKIETSYNSYKPCFVYDEETGKYGREQYGAAHIDSATGEQLVFDNVIVLSVTSRVVDKSGHRDFDDVGSGVGILATHGTYINIKWEKDTYTSPLVLTTEDGTPITVNTGKTFISYVNGESNISVSAE